MALGMPRRPSWVVFTALLLGSLVTFSWLYQYGYPLGRVYVQPPRLVAGEEAHDKVKVTGGKVVQPATEHPAAPTSAPSVTGSGISGESDTASRTAGADMATPTKAKAVTSGLTVVLRQGAYTGVVVSDERYPKPVEVFRGIPYAQSTAGDNRLRSPKPLDPSDESFKAVEFGRACPSGPHVYRAQGEDCLNANVYRPEKRPTDGSKMPVVIYVHGGGFNTGVGQERNMASFISWADHPIVSISFNYRLGALGFLPSTVTAREGILNLGLRDQQMLFRWVQENIAEFGGDPDNVTLMGMSAGAHSIGHHLLHYTKENAPFHKAILESGAPTARSVLAHTHTKHLVQFREFLVRAGVESSFDDEIVSSLRKLPLETFQNASASVWSDYQESLSWPFQPVVDSMSIGGEGDSIITGLPIMSWRKGQHLRIPIITGFNTDEGAAFIRLYLDFKNAFDSFWADLIPGFNKSDAAELERLYPDPGAPSEHLRRDEDPTDAELEALYSGEGSEVRSSARTLVNRAKPKTAKTPGKGWERLARAYGDYAYITPILQTAHFMSNVSNASSVPTKRQAPKATTSAQPVVPPSLWAPLSPDTGSRHEVAPVYVYQYAALNNRSGTTYGAADHGAQGIASAHEFDKLKKFQGLLHVADAMHGAFVNFVVSKHGDPNPPGSDPSSSGHKPNGMVHWPRFQSPFAEGRGFTVGEGSGDGEIVVFGEGNNERMEKGTGQTHAGTVAQVVRLADRQPDLERYRFWWDRVELSEGLGLRHPERSKAQRSRL